MNYRHHFHAGNFADVVKHVLLGALFRGLQRKENGFLYLDTHAGRGKYDLHSSNWGQSSPRMAEHPNGWGRLEEARLNVPQLVEDYCDAVRGFDRRCGNLDGKLRFYPGSPWLALQWMRPQDRLALCELNRSEYEALAKELEGRRRVSVHHLMDMSLFAHFFHRKRGGHWCLLIRPLSRQKNGWTWLNACGKSCNGCPMQRLQCGTQLLSGLELNSSWGDRSHAAATCLDGESYGPWRGNGPRDARLWHVGCQSTLAIGRGTETCRNLACRAIGAGERRARELDLARA